MYKIHCSTRTDINRLSVWLLHAASEDGRLQQYLYQWRHLSMHTSHKRNTATISVQVRIAFVDSTEMRYIQLSWTQKLTVSQILAAQSWGAEMQTY